MDYQPPDLCIMSLVEYKPGYYQIHMPSVYDPPGEPAQWEIDKTSLDNIREYYNVPMCPPGWPSFEPKEDCFEYHSARLGTTRATEICTEND